MSKIFAHRRSFMHQRAHIPASGGGQSVSNGQNGDGALPTTQAVDTPVPDPKTLDPLTILSSQSTQASTTPAAAATTPAHSTPTTSSPAASPSSTSSQAASVLSSSSSADASTPSSTGLTPSSIAPSTSAFVSPSLSTQVITQPSFAPTTTVSPTASSSAAPGSSGGTNTGAVIGGVAGALAGIAILGFLLMWCMRRQQDKDLDDFDALAFKRQSAILVDDPVESSHNLRPPTMIEHHNASPALAAQTGYSGQNFYGNYGAYNQPGPYPEMIQSIASPPPQAYGAQPMGYGYEGQQQLARQPSNATYLSRHPSASGFVPSAAPTLHDPSAQYINLNRTSVTPYQAAQYASISRQLGTRDPNAEVPGETIDIPDDPLPSPFDDPVDSTHSNHPVNVASHTPVTPPRTYMNTSEPHRPATVYEEGDIYGGI